MSYSSVWSSVPGATACVMIGLMVACRTVGNICRLTAPPRWIRPRTGGFSFASVPRPGAPGSLRRRPGRPFFRPRVVGPYARRHYHCFGSLEGLFGEYQLESDFISERQNAKSPYGNEKTAKAVL